MGLKGIDLSGRVALVTGGSRGIGRATVLRLAGMGARVLINYSGNERAALEVASAARELGAEAHSVRADVAQTEEAEKLVSACIERFGRLDILVCNAGVWAGAPVEEMSEELWDRIIEINLKGT